MNLKFSLRFYIALFFITSFLGAQQNDFITGVLIDSKTSEPIVFANIHLKNRSVGVISNLDGGFKIPTIYRDMSDILVISSMGYQRQELLLSDLSIYVINMIRLKPAVFELTEVVLKAKKKTKKELSAKEIVKKAIKAIPENYPVKPFSTVGYYRDYQIDKGEYVNLNEAILEVFDQGFKAIDTTTTRTRIYDYVQNKEFRRDTLSDKPYNYKQGSKVIVNAYMSDYGGNEFSTLRVHDAIRNYQLNSYDFINSMGKGDILEHHSFKRRADIFLNDRLLYVIDFERNKYDYSARGEIYISKTDYTIHKLGYAVYDNTKRNRIVKPIEKGELIFEVTTDYKRDSNDKMFLNYISFHNTFQLRQPPIFKLDFVGLDFERQRFILTFNNRIDSANALDLSNYEGFYKGKKIKFKSLITFDNQVFIYPILKTKKQITMWDVLKIESIKNTLNNDILDFKVRNIKDVGGNLINELISKDYNQFREFFVQEVKPNTLGPLDNLYMKKGKPIFENQPIIKPDNFDDYWMNTPLQNVDY